jgi:hypothetical protein
MFSFSALMFAQATGGTTKEKENGPIKACGPGRKGRETRARKGPKTTAKQTVGGSVTGTPGRKGLTKDTTGQKKY